MHNELAMSEVISDLANKILGGDFVGFKYKTAELITPTITFDPTQPILTFGDIRSTPQNYCRAEL